MRIAIVSDIHDNLTALEAVVRDLREVSPDVVRHGGDLAGGGSRSAEVVDWIRQLGWQGVAGNTDEAIVDPERLEAVAAQSSAPAALWTAVREQMAFARAALGSERIAWLRGLPRILVEPPLALVHASPATTWHAAHVDAPPADLHSTFARLGQPVVVYGHVHVPRIRAVTQGLTVINTGAVGQSLDGDPRAAYLVLDDGMPVIRRVAYDIEREIAALTAVGVPYARWTAATLRHARASPP